MRTTALEFSELLRQNKCAVRMVNRWVVLFGKYPGIFTSLVEADTYLRTRADVT